VSGASWMLERLMGTEASRDADTLVLKADIIRKRRVEGMAAGAEGDKEEKEVGARDEEGFAGSASIESAVEMYSQALKQKPSHQRARVGLARAKGDQDSEVAIREVVKESPHSVLAWKELGELLEERGGHLAARQAFEMALSLCPRDTLCLERAAVLCEAQGDDAAHALSLWERLLEIVPGHKGGLEAKMKQCDDLEELNARFKAATEASPTDVELAIAYSVLLESRVGDRARAGSVLDKALDLDQWNVDLLCRRARVSLGSIPLSQHHCDEAQGLYQRAMEANPSHLDTLLGYAEFLDKVNYPVSSLPSPSTPPLTGSPYHQLPVFQSIARACRSALSVTCKKKVAIFPTKLGSKK
jgi:tetratricopeptide (TPR) repeat protein